MHADSLQRKLFRLVSYKIYQIQIAERGFQNPLDWNRLEGSTYRENLYSTSCLETASLGPYEKALWAYYLLLEKKLLKFLEQEKSHLKSQISIRELQKKINPGI